MSEANPLAHLVASIPAEIVPEEAKQIHWILTLELVGKPMGLDVPFVTSF